MIAETKSHTKRPHSQFGLERAEIIAALVDDSTGYLSPAAAELHLEKWERGQDGCCCERCYSVFSGDLNACLLSAKKHWQYLGLEERRRLLGLVKQMETLDPIGQTTAGLMYRTMAAGQEQ